MLWFGWCAGFGGCYRCCGSEGGVEGDWFACDEVRDCDGVEACFELEDAVCECLRRVCWEDRAAGLCDDRAGVVVIVAEVDGAT